MLFGATLTGQNLSEFNFCNANLIEADLRRATLTKANFHEANLGGAKLIRADLTGANFCRTDLFETNLSRADLTGANLQGTQLARTNFERAKLIGCTIYGLSAWDLKLEGAVQKDLRILYKVETPKGKWNEGEFIVDDLEVAQFVYLVLNNERISKVIDTMTAKAVLILGRFEPEERKAVLEGLRSELRTHGLLPIVFDFKKPKDRDFTETIKTLVGLCRFVIVDITNPRSSPLELDATVKDYAVPFVPIIQEGEKPFSMFEDLRKYPWMLNKVTYRSTDALRSVTKGLIIDRAFRMYKRLQRLKGRQEMAALSAEEYLASRAKKRSVPERSVGKGRE